MKDKLIGFLMIMLLFTGCSGGNNNKESNFDGVSDILIASQESYDKREDEYFIFKGILEYERRVSELNGLYKPEEGEKILKEYKGELLRITPEEKELFACDRKFLESFKLKDNSDMLSLYIKYKSLEYGEKDEEEKHGEYILQLQPLVEDIYLEDDRYGEIARTLLIDFFGEYAPEQDEVEEYVDGYLQELKHSAETE